MMGAIMRVGKHADSLVSDKYNSQEIYSLPLNGDVRQASFPKGKPVWVPTIMIIVHSMEGENALGFVQYL